MEVPWYRTVHRFKANAGMVGLGPNFLRRMVDPSGYDVARWGRRVPAEEVGDMRQQVDASIGQRVAALRKLRGLTQEGFALRLNRSASWVAKIERGARRVDSMVVIHELARALGVSPRELADGPDNLALRSSETTLVDGLPELRRVLDRSAAMTSMVDVESVPTATMLGQSAASLRQAYNRTSRSVPLVVPRLAGLIADAQRAIALAAGDDHRSAFAALSSFYRLASLELRQLGDLPRARVAIDRALTCR